MQNITRQKYKLLKNIDNYFLYFSNIEQFANGTHKVN